MRLLNVLRLVAFLLIGSCLVLADSADQLIQRVEKRYNSAQTLAVGFS